MRNVLIAMLSTWVLATLLAFLTGTRYGNTSLCGEVQTSTPVVASGSHVTASCVITDDCPLAKGQDVHLQWHLGQHPLPSSPAVNGSERISRVYISSFTDIRAFLTCCVLEDQDCRIVGGVEIRAGFSPSVPQNLSCLTNLTTPSTLSCNWDPGQDTQLPTQYTLYTNISDLPVSKREKTYELPPGVHHYTIPRSDFVLFSEMEIFVKAVNVLGQATSKHLLLEPVGAAKFEPPKILKVQSEPNRYGCLKLRWCLSDQQVWVPVPRLSLEVLLKPTDNEEQSELTVPTTSVILVARVVKDKPVEVCRLLHGKEYLAQIRVRYNQSPWSEWSSSHGGVTQEKAPTGRLDVWMKLPEEQRQKNLTVHLLWKPSTQFRANSRNVSYTVSLQRAPGDRGQVCATSSRHCAFKVPRGTRRVFLRAVNAVGRSSPTDVLVYRYRDLPGVSDVSVIPCGDTSLRVEWANAASADITGYVVEWKSLFKMDLSLIFFDRTDRNQSSTVISEGIEPYRPYGISVYAMYKHGIGLSKTVEAYSRQKAPSKAPTLTISKNRQSYIELTWDEIPISQRNGIIQNYKIFYWEKQGTVNVVNADITHRRVVLKNLTSVASFEAFIMVSTESGSLNGSAVHFVKPETIDALEILIAMIVVCVGVSLFVIFTALTCFTKNKRLKMCFWPMIPDPANSSIKKWNTSETIQDFPPFQDTEESTSVFLSHLSFMDIPKRIIEEGGGKFTDDSWIDCESVEHPSDLGESICGSQIIPGYCRSQQESVPYGSVFFVGPYESQPVSPPASQPASPPASQPASKSRIYLRSESTQPLLSEEEPDSPKLFLNTHAHNHKLPGEQATFRECHGGVQGQAGVSTLWDDFPLLRALTINDTESEI